MKTRTAWTFAYMFKDENYWDESVKGKDLVQQIVKKEEERTLTVGLVEVLDEDLDEALSSITYQANRKSPMIDEIDIETDDQEFENERER